MARKTSVLGFSVSPALAKEYERLAEREGTTKSDLFRRMVTTYKEVAPLGWTACSSS